MKTSILIADIGGTSSRFARCELINQNEFNIVSDIIVNTADYASLNDLLTAIAILNPLFALNTIDCAVLAVPGPVIANKQVSLANVSWDIDLQNQSFACPMYLINDFEAQAWGCVNIQAAQFTEIKASHYNLHRGFAVIGAGTGLGHCAVKLTNNLITTIPSEAGHIRFNFVNAEELEYSQFLKTYIGNYPISDQIVSGSGLAYLHQFLTNEQLTPAQVAATLQPDSPTTIWFARFFARACQNYVLSCLGICDTLFLTGGIAIKNPFLVNNRYFMEEFINCSTKKAELDAINIKLANFENLGLIGCIRFAQQLLFIS